MITAAIIRQVAKVELRVFDGTPPWRFRLPQVVRPMFVPREPDPTELVPLNLNYLELTMHRMRGFYSFDVAYWSDRWQESWAIEELLKFEGREDEIRHDKFYGEYFGSKSVVIPERSEKNVHSARN